MANASFPEAGGLSVTGALSSTTAADNNSSIISTANSVSLNLQCADTGSVTINAGGTSNPNKGRLLYSDNSDLWKIYTGDTDRVTVDSTGLSVTGALSATTRIDLPSYTVGTLPAVGVAGGQIYVSNETGGAVPAFSDGTNWRRVTDRAIVA